MHDELGLGSEAGRGQDAKCHLGRKRPEWEKRGRLPTSVSSEGRPAVGDRRSRYGNWEGDTIVGANRRGGAVTLVERKSGYLLLGRVPQHAGGDLPQTDLIGPHTPA